MTKRQDKGPPHAERKKAPVEARHVKAKRKRGRYTQDYPRWRVDDLFTDDKGRWVFRPMCESSFWTVLRAKDHGMRVMKDSKTGLRFVTRNGVQISPEFSDWNNVRSWLEFEMNGEE